MIIKRTAEKFDFKAFGQAIKAARKAKEIEEAYLRKMAIDGYIIQVDHTDIKAMTAEIQKIGVNINQIAKRVRLDKVTIDYFP